MKKTMSLALFALNLTLGFFISTMHAAPSRASTSLYEVKLDSFTDDAQKEIKLVDFKGKKVVMSMIYTSCEHACPMIMKKLKKIDDQLKANKITADFVIVSFDTKFDSPKKLAAFRKHYEGTDERWHFLIGSEKSTRMLANVLDIKYSRNPEDQSISHDNKVVFLDEKGVIVNTQEGLTFDQKAKTF